MITLHTLNNKVRGRRAVKRLGRGPGSGLGKTAGRGQKGAGARSGHKHRWGYEGGQMRLHMKLPQRGFSNVRFQRRLDTINLDLIDEIFSDGDVVNLESLRKHGIIGTRSFGVKILGNGILTKKVTIEADAYSDGARKKLADAKIEIKEKV